MAHKRHKAEETVNKLRQADVELGKGSTVASMCRILGVTEVGLVRGWLAQVGVKTLFVEPGSPWENGYVESY